MNIRIMPLKKAKERFKNNEYTDYKPPPAFYNYPSKTMFIVAFNEKETVNTLIHETMHEVLHKLAYDGLFKGLPLETWRGFQDKFDCALSQFF